MSANRPYRSTRPDYRQEIGPSYGYNIRDPLLAAIAQAVEQQKQQEQQKAQVMQSLGFGGNMSQFGAIPQGHGITQMDGKVWTRPGGTPPGIQMLLETLTGSKPQNAARFTGFTGNLPTTRLNTPSVAPAGQMNQFRLQQAMDAHKNARTLDEVQQLYYIYPEEMDYLLGGGNK